MKCLTSFKLFRKNCFIEYSETAQEVTVEICRETLIKDCDSPGPEVSFSPCLIHIKRVKL